MQTIESNDRAGHRLIQLGIILFLAGLLTGFVIPLMANPRVGLSSHLEGVMNGLLLVALGVIWPRLTLGRGTRRLAFGLAVFGTVANWLGTLLAGIWGTGAMMPIAAAGQQGSSVQELIVSVLLMALSFAMVAAIALVIWGVRRARDAGAVLASNA